MELALYHPEHGYYERTASQVGRSGDFLTSVSTGPFFGELLAARFTNWHGSNPQTSHAPLHIIEAGAHDGSLASDVLKSLAKPVSTSQSATAYRYTVLEPSPRRCEYQKSRLKPFHNHVEWIADITSFPQGSLRGVIFSNELLDAFPVHRVAWSASRQCWFEWLINVSSGRFIWSPSEAPLPASLQALVPASLAEASRLNHLPNGYACELCPAAVDWWRNACSTIETGWVVAIDYGTDDAGHLAPHRIQGTLRGFTHHRVCGDVLTEPGSMDITSHVNFTALRKVGESAGMITAFWGTQEKFLVDCLHCWMPHHAELTASQAAQFKQLTHPEAMGRKFSVLVQRRP